LNVKDPNGQLEDSTMSVFYSTVHLLDSSLNHFGENFRKKQASVSVFASTVNKIGERFHEKHAGLKQSAA